MKTGLKSKLTLEPKWKSGAGWGTRLAARSTDTKYKDEVDASHDEDIDNSSLPKVSQDAGNDVARSDGNRHSRVQPIQRGRFTYPASVFMWCCVIISMVALKHFDQWK
ncbi:hypothetical protein EVAR_39716_1 [Eumeta japonica]|uniref:Uncharacterized protein n=1 Tax=Eumeta variegata TaxID=151549 RepID=A0A4C1W728_EUMVA|nr:hypothetical protein EVAR_39716_1 [Eumeta japonica]